MTVSCVIASLSGDCGLHGQDAFNWRRETSDSMMIETHHKPWIECVLWSLITFPVISLNKALQIRKKLTEWLSKLTGRVHIYLLTYN